MKSNNSLTTISDGAGVVSIYPNCLTIAEVLSQFNEPIVEMVMDFDSMGSREQWATILESIGEFSTTQVTRHVNTVWRTTQQLEKLSELNITSIPRLGYEGQCAAVLLYTHILGEVFISKSVYETGKLDNATLLSILLKSGSTFRRAKLNAKIISDYVPSDIETINTVTLEEVRCHLAILSFTEEACQDYYDIILFLRQYCVSAGIVMPVKETDEIIDTTNASIQTPSKDAPAQPKASQPVIKWEHPLEVFSDSTADNISKMLRLLEQHDVGKKICTSINKVLTKALIVNKEDLEKLLDTMETKSGVGGKMQNAFAFLYLAFHGKPYLSKQFRDSGKFTTYDIASILMYAGAAYQKVSIYGIDIPISGKLLRKKETALQIDLVKLEKDILEVHSQQKQSENEGTRTYADSNLKGNQETLRRIQIVRTFLQQQSL